jgi:hypothetical protein
MNSDPASADRSGLSLGRALLLGTLLVGTLDIVFAILFYGARGVPAARIFQSISSGLLGRASYDGGAPTVALGAFLQYVISFGIVATYLGASRRFAALRRHAVILGPLYGVVVYFVMTRVVVPLSAAAVGKPPHGIVLVAGLLAHMLLIGLPSTLVARAAVPPSPREAPNPAV